MTLLERAKIRLGITHGCEDALIKTLLDDARDYILSYTKRCGHNWLDTFNSIQVRIACIEYQRLGHESIQSQSEGGVSVTYSESEEGYPPGIAKALNPYRLVRVIK